MSDTGRNKTVVTAISKISDRPVAKEACLVVIYGLELGKKFNLNRPQIIIGRSSKADIQIDQEAVSRNHCKILNTGNAIMLRDMGSTNGTYVNDEMIDEYVLRDGDFIKVGRCIFKFLSGNNIDKAVFTARRLRLERGRGERAGVASALVGVVRRQENIPVTVALRRTHRPVDDDGIGDAVTVEIAIGAIWFR